MKFKVKEGKKVCSVYTGPYTQPTIYAQYHYRDGYDALRKARKEAHRLNNKEGIS